MSQLQPGFGESPRLPATEVRIDPGLFSLRARNASLQPNPAPMMQRMMQPCNYDLPRQRETESFFYSGKTGETPNIEAAKFIVDTAPSFDDDSADFNVVFCKNIKLRNRTFEENVNFKPKGKRGEGISGSVTAHVDTSTNNSFVRKHIKKGNKMRSEEVKAMLAISHPGICSLYGMMVHNGQIDILMQDAGLPLRSFLKKVIEKGMAQGILTENYWTMVKDLTLQGFQAIQEMHRCGVNHLDIKPENYLAHRTVEGNPRLVLADFGSALIGSVPMDLQLQLTPEYMAPELWELYRKYGRGAGGREMVRPTHDVYAFGLTVYFMCSLRHLWLELIKVKDTIFSPAAVDQFTQGSMDANFGFKFLLMTEKPFIIQEFAKNGPWIFPGSPPPECLLEIMQRTLDPNPDTRWTEDDVISYLTGDVIRTAPEEEEIIKTPTQASDDSEDMLLQQNLTMRPPHDGEVAYELPASNHYTAVPATEDQDVMQPFRLDADVRAYAPLQQPVQVQHDMQQPPTPYGLPPALPMRQASATFVPAGPETVVKHYYNTRSRAVKVESPEAEEDHPLGWTRNVGKRAQPMHLNSNVDLMEVEMEEEGDTGGATAALSARGDKVDVDMDMHRSQSCSQAQVPDLPLVQEQEALGFKKPGWPGCQGGGDRGKPFQFVLQEAACNPQGMAGGNLQVFQLTTLGITPKKPAVLQQAPPTPTSLGKGGSFRGLPYPKVSAGKHGKQIGPGGGMRGVVAGKNIKPQGKNLSFLSHSKKMLTVGEVTNSAQSSDGQVPVPFCVGSIGRPSLATGVIPPPSPIPKPPATATSPPTPGGVGFGHADVIAAGSWKDVNAFSPAQFVVRQPQASRGLSAARKFISPWAVNELDMPPSFVAGGDAANPLNQEPAKVVGNNVPNLDMLL